MNDIMLVEFNSQGGAIMVNKDKLCGKMREHHYTIDSLSKRLNLSKTGLFNKIHGKKEFLCSEIQTIKIVLELNQEDFDAIFFGQKVE